MTANIAETEPRSVCFAGVGNLFDTTCHFKCNFKHCAIPSKKKELIMQIN